VNWTALHVQQSNVGLSPFDPTAEASPSGEHRVGLNARKFPNGEAAGQSAEARRAILLELRGRLLASAAGQNYAAIRAEAGRADVAAKRAALHREQEELTQRRTRLVSGDEHAEDVAEALLALEKRATSVADRIDALDRQAATLREVDDARRRAALTVLGEAKSNVVGSLLGSCQDKVRALGERIVQLPEVAELLNAMVAAAIERDAARSLGALTADSGLLDKLLDLTDVS
jgi:hypothetical protein